MDSISELTPDREQRGVSVTDLDAYVRQLNCPAAVTDCDGRLLCANASFGALFPGISTDSGTPTVDLPTLLQERCRGRQAAQDLANLQAQITEGCQSGRCVVERDDEEKLQIQILPQIGCGGCVRYRIWEFVSLRHNRRLLERAAHSEKMHAISRLAGGMAHEFNNLLTVVLGNLDLIRVRPDAVVGRILSHVDSAESAAQRASRLIHELRRFASRDLPVRKPQQIAPIVRRVRRILAGMVPQHVNVTVTISSDETRLQASVSADGLVEALVKLGVNSIEAIDRSSGEIALLVVEDRLPTDSKPAVRISLADTGGGMCQNSRERAFEPFFTTRAIPTASGLGLAMAYSLVEEMGGTIGIDESTPAGTRMSILFPLS